MSRALAQSLKPYAMLIALLVVQTACARQPATASPTPATTKPLPSEAGGQPGQAQPRLLRILARDRNALRRQLYTPDFRRIARMRDGNLLILFHSVCTGSADGHCQAVDVFLNGGVRAIWHHQYDGVLAVDTSSTGFSVRAVTYAPGDPLCCSSLPPVVDTYTWTGKGFRESGPLPQSPGA